MRKREGTLISTRHQSTDRAAAVRGLTWRLVTAWILSLFGLAWASLLSFAGSMRTVPSLTLSEALLTTPIPLLALALLANVVLRGRREGASRKYLLRAALPALAALLALMAGWSLYFQLGMS